MRHHSLRASKPFIILYKSESINSACPVENQVDLCINQPMSIGHDILGWSAAAVAVGGVLVAVYKFKRIGARTENAQRILNDPDLLEAESRANESMQKLRRKGLLTPHA